MTVQNGTIDGVTLLSSNPNGHAPSAGTRKAFLLSVSFPAFNSGTDSATITGINTAIAAAERNGRALTLRAVVPANACYDGSVDIYFTGASVQAAALANTTTTGDATGSNQLSQANGTIQTSAATTQDLQVIAIVDEA